MSTDFWDEFAQPDNRFKFEQIGQSVAGTITNIKITDFGGKGDRTPELWISTSDGDDVTVTASQTMLRAALAAERPQIGDRIAIVYTGDGQAKPGKSAPKLFDVKVARGGQAAAATPPAQAPAQAPAEPQPQPATAPAAAPQQQPVGAGVSAADLI